jgi:acetyl esterase/lipase
MMIGVLMALLWTAGAQAEVKTLKIWPGLAPGSEHWTQKEVEFPAPEGQGVWIRNVVTPTLTAYLPDSAKAKRTAVIVAPGGGFYSLTWTHATRVAEWLASRGITAFVLKYRLVDTGATAEEHQERYKKLVQVMKVVAEAANNGKPAPVLDGDLSIAMKLGIEDGRQAIRFVRKNSKELSIDADRIGIMGLSAGGFVALGAAIEHDARSRPDFIAPIYTPWFSDGIRIPVDAAPAFIAVTSDDFIAVPGSLKIFNEWRAAGKSAELHIYSKGGHGFGADTQGLPVDSWLERFQDWLNKAL